MDELVTQLQGLDRDDAIRCIVLGGSERVFAAGADIGELARSSAIELYYARRVERWDAIRNLWTPIVAAVSGYCLGGGCELALACDLIVASESARFGQPETSLGIIPGAGGTQRLTRAVGKATAMDVILSGRLLSAEEALAAGLVARVVAREAWLDEAKRVARDIASKGPVATRLAKEAVNRAYESTLQLGLEHGSVPAGGATQWLPVFVGDRRAREIIYMCEQIPAAQAAEWGLVNWVVPAAELDAKVDEVVEKLARKLPQTTRYAKQQLNFWRDLSWHETVNHARDWLALSMATEEPRRAIERFLERE